MNNTHSLSSVCLIFISVIICMFLGTRLLTQVLYTHRGDKIIQSFNCSFFPWRRQLLIGQSRQIYWFNFELEIFVNRSIRTLFFSPYNTVKNLSSVPALNPWLPGLSTPLICLRKRAKIVSTDFQFDDTLA